MFLKKTKTIYQKAKREFELRFGSERTSSGRILQSLDKKRKSVLFFTTHKCASSFINILLEKIVISSDYDNINYTKSIRRLGDKTSIIDTHKYLKENYQYLFVPYGEIYAPLRKPVIFPGSEEYRHIFFLRDPRDILVSGFHSFGRTHPVPINKEKKETFLQRRKEINEMGIDKFTLKEAVEWVKPIYAEYRLMRSTVNDSIYLKYDLFKEDPREFIERINAYLDLGINDTLAESLANLAEPVQKEINDSAHKRSGNSNQFKKELKPETILELNDILREELEYWEFSL